MYTTKCCKSSAIYQRAFSIDCSYATTLFLGFSATPCHPYFMDYDLLWCRSVLEPKWRAWGRVLCQLYAHAPYLLIRRRIFSRFYTRPFHHKSEKYFTIALYNTVSFELSNRPTTNYLLFISIRCYLHWQESTTWELETHLRPSSS